MSSSPLGESPMQTPKVEAAAESTAITKPEATPMDDCIIDPRGDLWLHAQGVDSAGCADQLRFRVCSRALARASLVFEKMLFGSFAEASGNQSGGDWVIELPDDASSAMRILFEIMHSRYQRLTAWSSTQPSFIPLLYDLLVVADKYDCIGLFRPWAASWVHHLKVEGKSEQDVLRLGWIFHQLGHGDGYEAVMARLIMDFPVTRSTADAEAFAALAPPVLPPDLLERAEIFRGLLASDLLEPIANNVEMLVKDTTAPSLSAGLCRVSPFGLSSNLEASECKSKLLGKAIRNLHKQDLWPLPESSTVTLSLRTLDMLISRLAIECRASTSGPHYLCSAIFPPLRSCISSASEYGILYYGTDYIYGATGGDEAHFVARSELTGIELLAPDKLLEKCNVPFLA
ncbi:BTB/POZ domain-containing protein [Microdochium nivale]|nr:BTB/POZ domain-containing protein [Microdochium nivale]